MWFQWKQDVEIWWGSLWMELGLLIQISLQILELQLKSVTNALGFHHVVVGLRNLSML